MVRVRKKSKFEQEIFLELNIPCERAHCKLQENVKTAGIGPSQLKLWLIECETASQSDLQV